MPTDQRFESIIWISFRIILINIDEDSLRFFHLIKDRYR